MSTSPESNDNTTATPQRDEAPVLEEPAPHDTPASANEADDATQGTGAQPGDTYDEWDDEAATTAPSKGPGVLTAETFAITGLLAISTAIVGTRMTENLPSLIGQSQEGMFAGLIMGDGVISLLAVVFAAVSLFLAGASTHPWARWVATATVIVGVIFVAGSVTTYMLVPEPQPQPPMMPSG